MSGQSAIQAEGEAAYLGCRVERIAERIVVYAIVFGACWRRCCASVANMHRRESLPTTLEAARAAIKDESPAAASVRPQAAG